MPYESHKYYNGNLYVGIAMDVKKTTFRRPLCEYYNGCKKLATITRLIFKYYNICKKLTTIMRLICGYYNGCKKQHLLEDLYAGIAMDVKH